MGKTYRGKSRDKRRKRAARSKRRNYCNGKRARAAKWIRRAVMEDGNA